MFTWNRVLTNEVKQTSEPIDNPRILFFVIGGISFFAGNLCQEILYFPAMNFVFSFIVMLIITLITYRAFSFNFAYRVYAWWRLFQEFREWKNGSANEPVIPPIINRSRRISNSSTIATTESPHKTPEDTLTLSIPPQQQSVGVQKDPSFIITKKDDQTIASHPTSGKHKRHDSLFLSDSEESTDDEEDSDNSIDEEKIVTATSITQRSILRRRSDSNDKQLFGDPNINSDEEEISKKTSKSPTIASKPLIENISTSTQNE